VGAATSSDTVAALFAHGMGATYTENDAVSGAVVADLPGQIAMLKRAHYDTILVMIGGNDITHLHTVRKVSAQLSIILATLATKGDRVLLMSAGNVGGAPTLPPPTRPFFTWLNLKYHTAFARVAAATGATYINLYTPPSEDVIVQHPEIYLAADSFHPSSAGYALWYKRITHVITP
jgi:lysophospholipase L1-like esterase